MRYRCKVYLRDGRSVYFSKRGKLTLWTEQDMKTWQKSMPIGGGYTLDLGMYLNEGAIAELDVPVIRVVCRCWEPETEPLDPSTVMLGNIKPNKMLDNEP